MESVTFAQQNTKNSSTTIKTNNAYKNINKHGSAHFLLYLKVRKEVCAYATKFRILVVYYKYTVVNSRNACY